MLKMQMIDIAKTGRSLAYFGGRRVVVCEHGLDGRKVSEGVGGKEGSKLWPGGRRGRGGGGA